MQLLIVDENDKLYKVKDIKCFDEIDKEGVLAIYKQLYSYIEIDKVLNNLANEGILIKEGDPESIDNLNYSLDCLGNYINERFGLKTFNQIQKECKTIFEVI